MEMVTVEIVMSIQQSKLAHREAHYSSETGKKYGRRVGCYYDFGGQHSVRETNGAEFHRIARFWVPTVYHALDSEASKTRLCSKSVWNSVKVKDNKHIHYNTLETAGLRERRE